MKVVVGGIKGGSGKTTLATNLVVMRAAEGKKVLFVDADEQKSATDWVDQREGDEIETKWTTIQLGGNSLHLQLKKMIGDYDDVIVDVGGRNTQSQISAVSIADLFIVPFKPRSLDIWTLGQVKNLISLVKGVNPDLISIAVVNQADSRGTDNEDAITLLKEYSDFICCPSMIGHRKAFANAAADGKGVIEIEADTKAVQEMKAIYEYVFNTCYISALHG